MFFAIPNIILFIIFFWICLKILRLAYEVAMTKNLVYMKVTLPRADSKLDKEKETKKDFKEKVGVMSVVYKSIHKMAETSFFITIGNLVFRHAKVSFEFVYSE